MVRSVTHAADTLSLLLHIHTDGVVFNPHGGHEFHTKGEAVGQICSAIGFYPRVAVECELLYNTAVMV